MMVEKYAKILTESINKIADTQCKKIVQAAKLVGKSILADGLIYIFGCGHSHILSEEAFTGQAVLLVSGRFFTNH